MFNAEVLISVRAFIYKDNQLVTLNFFNSQVKKKLIYFFVAHF